MTKACRDCGQVLSLSAFPKDKSCKDGHRHVCKECRSEATRESKRQYHQRNREQRAAQSAAWRAANPDKVKAYSKAGAQRRKEYHRAWRAANPDKVSAYRAAYDSQASRTDFLTQWRAAQS